ncbi:EI24 domain-containing protein [Sporobolomyces salmoneus]|uniref:EI24 domain-containing protein n=1 Tax=Sporobolomyces salmoneus TaxID=183962 RepID=UPI0031700032
MSFYGHKKQESSFGGGGGGSSWSLPPLPLSQTLSLHLNFALKGAQDAVRFQVAGEKLSIDKVAQANVLKSTLLQGIVLISALLIKPILRRSVGIVEGSSTRGVTSSILYILFHVFWLYPVAGIATYYSGLLRPSPESSRRGIAARQSNPQNAAGGQMSKLVAESYRTLVTINYFAVYFTLRMIPFVGGLFSFLYACIVDAYYCFEQHWLQNGWPFDDRVRQIEQRWAYALGFGFPITFLSWWSSDPIVNLAIFALLYPFFQLTSTTSIPQPLDPSLPSTSSTAASFLSANNSNSTPAAGASFSIAAAEGGSEDRGRRGSPWVPERMRVLGGAELGYRSLRSAFGGPGGGGGMGPGARKKDAYGHGHGGGVRSGNPYGGGGYAASTQQGGGIDPHSQTQSSAYGSTYSSTSSANDPYSAAPYAGQVPQATPPRRGHAMNDSTSATSSTSPYGNASSPYSRAGGASGVSGMGGGYGGDRHLDSLLRAAGGRKKGD